MVFNTFISQHQIKCVRLQCKIVYLQHKMCSLSAIYVLHYALHSISPIACGCLLCDIVEAGNRGDKVLQNFISSRDQWTCKKYEQGRDKNTQED